MACSGPGKAETLEGFHEVNLASPTTPDLQNQAEQRPPQPPQCPPPPFCTAHTPWERPLLAAPPPCGPTSSPRSPSTPRPTATMEVHRARRRSLWKATSCLQRTERSAAL
ncbi:hypothetical protein CesoFtcFv8_026320 [Champsocephalus esox]|uniref:Uncharacterized protein n=1 Tax=Champsocephalus esox TaxID=159716 RepID=A0AAN8B225_9TELE|nr:hypothetical protein CesoFtcFv8_026320 [Champsocephalus esox]